jgi:hypothetical protein
MLIKWILVVLSLLSMNTSAQNIINYAGNFVSNGNVTPPAPWQLIQFAVAADTDNTGEYAYSGFADLHFVPKTQSVIFHN